MNFDIPEQLVRYLAELDAFIEREIKPLEQQDDNIRFFDHRREDARTDWERGGLPDRGVGAAAAQGAAAGRRGRPSTATRCPRSTAARDGTNLGMAVIREHLAAQGPRACTTTCRTSTRSSATTSACC